jgi:hypothetical protein
MSPPEPTESAEALPPARLTIHRTSADDEQSRQILCSLDGDYIGQLLFGETLTRELPAGTHRLSINNTLYWKNVSFTATAGEHVEFTVMNLLFGGTLMKMLFVFFGAAPLKLAVVAGPPLSRGGRPQRPPRAAP